MGSLGPLGHRVVESIESVGSVGSMESIGSIESSGSGVDGAVGSTAALGRGRKAGGCGEIDGEQLGVRAGVHTLPGCSAHADQIGLMDWVASMPAKSGGIRLVHGEARAAKALGERLRAAVYRVE